MATTVYSKSFFRGSHSGGQAVVYTAPPLSTTVIRQITAYNSGSVADAIEVAIGVPADATPIWHVNDVSSSSGSISFECRIVLPVQENIYIATGGQEWYVTISGYDLASST